MSKIADIKDNSPNETLINHLEEMLEEAKAGQLRSIFYVKGWSDDCVSEGWAMDHRTTGLRFLGGLTKAVADFTMVNVYVDRDSAFHKTIEDG